jgi:hypothetical protein
MSNCPSWCAAARPGLGGRPVELMEEALADHPSRKPSTSGIIAIAWSASAACRKTSARWFDTNRRRRRLHCPKGERASSYAGRRARGSTASASLMRGHS